MKLKNAPEGTVPLGLRLKPELRADIEMLAADEGLCLSSFAKRAILQDVKRRLAARREADAAACPRECSAPLAR